jgi:hypothetical protein
MVFCGSHGTGDWRGGVLREEKKVEAGDEARRIWDRRSVLEIGKPSPNTDSVSTWLELSIDRQIIRFNGLLIT